MTEKGCWRTIAAQGPSAATLRFMSSGARVAVVDGREALDETLAVVRGLAETVEVNAAALLVLLSRDDVHRLQEVFEAGATHYLADPFGEAELLQALRFADRHAERLGRRAMGLSWPEAVGEAEGEAERPSPLDPLTGLPDTAACRRWIAGELAGGRSLGLLLVGLDRLQLVNSFYGWAGGDVLLQAAVRRVQTCLDELDHDGSWMGRLAGTEFVIGLPGASNHDLARAAEAIKQAVERRFVAAPEVLLLTAHIGGLVATEEDAGAALRRASSALAEAREGGRGAVRLLEAESPEAVPRAHQLAEELWGAIEDGQIEVLFQPIVCIANGQVEGVEALSRWRHPRLGELGAEALFAAAERAHLTAALNEHVQRQALAAAATWTGPLAHLRISLNVGAGEIARPEFAREMLARIDSHSLDRERVTLEVTEEGLIEDLGPAADMLATLRAGGCRVAIDDFGTGYSSLAYLKALPLDYLKLDKRLSQDITGSPRDRVVVRSVIDMARSLGLDVVAEGVETAEQLELLAAEGCTFYQGYLCAPPLSAADLAKTVDQAARRASPRES